jgi:hypothetical protein
MRWLLVLLTTALLAPWPGIPAMPDGTGVTVLRKDGLARRAIGEVKERTLTLQAQGARLNANEEVAVWVSLPNDDSTKVLVLAGRSSSDGLDIMLVDGVTSQTSATTPLSSKDRTSLRALLREAYRIELKFKEPEARNKP